MKNKVFKFWEFLEHPKTGNFLLIILILLNLYWKYFS